MSGPMFRAAIARALTGFFDAKNALFRARCGMVSANAAITGAICDTRMSAMPKIR